MIAREATIQDIPKMQMIRNAVTENALSDPSLVPYEDYEIYITQRGKGWVCELDKEIVGFSIADLQENNIWALFVKTGNERKGIGRMLHDTMLQWYFNETNDPVWLSTAPGTRAENFYRTAGWKETGTYGKGETKFEMTYQDWLKIKGK